MKKKTFCLLFLMAAGFLLPFPVFAEEPVAEDKNDEKTIILRITDSDGAVLEGVQIALYDQDDPDSIIQQWTSNTDLIEISGFEESHSYFIKETEVPDGFYYLEDIPVSNDETEISMMHTGIDISVGINDPFEHEDPMTYPLQIIDSEGNVITETAADESGTTVPIDTSLLKAGEKYTLHADTEMFFPDHEFEIPLYAPQEPLIETIDFQVTGCIFHITDSYTSEYLPGVRLEIKDTNDYPVFEFATEEQGEESEIPVYSHNLISGQKYTVHVAEAPEYYALPEDLEILISEEKEEEKDLSFDIGLTPYIPFSLHASGSDGNVINDAEYTLFTDKDCTEMATDTKGNEAVLHITESIADINMPYGTYYLKETAYPDYYYHDDNVRELIFDSSSEKPSELSVQLTRIKASIMTVSPVSRKSANGSKMRLSDENGSVLHEWNSDKVSFDDLKAGHRYTIQTVSVPYGFFYPDDTILEIPLTSPEQDIIEKTISLSPFRVQIRSADGTGKPVAGNIMQLYSGESLIKEWTSENGYTEMTSLSCGETYTVRFKNAADHYIPGKEISFSIPPKYEGINEYTYEITCTPYVTTSILASDTGGEKINNAEYGIFTDPDCSQPAKGIDGNSISVLHIKDGSITADLFNGTYYIKQLSVPEEYYLSKQVYVLHADRMSSATPSISVTSKPVLYSFGLEDTDTGDLLEGGTLRLTDDSGNVIREWNSSSSPFSLHLKRNAMYVLEQPSAPSGYIYGGSTTFHTAEYEPSQDTEYVSIRNTGFVSLGILLTRSDAVSVPVSNGRFALFKDRECTKLLSTIEGTSASAFTGWDGSVYWNLYNGTYYLKEMSAPDHFYTDPEIYEITVNHRTGKTYIKRITNVPVTFYVNAVCENDSIEGAGIQVFDSENSLIEEWTSTDARHMMNFMNLAPGETYRIHISKVPEGYENAEEDIFFSLPSYEPQSIPSVILEFTRPQEKPEIIVQTPEPSPEPLTEEEKMQKADSWILPLVSAMAAGTGFLLFLIWKKKREDEDETS